MKAGGKIFCSILFSTVSLISGAGNTRTDHEALILIREDHQISSAYDVELRDNPSLMLSHDKDSVTEYITSVHAEAQHHESKGDTALALLYYKILSEYLLAERDNGDCSKSLVAPASSKRDLVLKCYVSIALIMIILYVSLRYVWPKCSQLKRNHTRNYSVDLVDSKPGNDHKSETPLSPEQRYNAIMNLRMKLTDPGFSCNDMLKTDGYLSMHALVSQNKPLTRTDETWDLLFRSIDIISPSFFYNLGIITNTALTDNDLRMVALIRAQITTTEIATLLCLETSAISHRKRKLCRKIFNDLVDPKEFYPMLRALSLSRLENNLEHR